MLIPRLRAFSETARFIDSEAPSGNSADTSTTSRTEAFGSLLNTETISSAIYSLIQTPDGDAAAGRLVIVSIMLALGALIAAEWFARRATARLHGN